MSKSMILLVTIFGLWLFLIMSKNVKNNSENKKEINLNKKIVSPGVRA